MALDDIVSVGPRIHYVPELLQLAIGMAALAAHLAGSELVDEIHMIPRSFKNRSHAFALDGLMVPVDRLLPVSDCNYNIIWFSV